jgi:hypothetical protein
VTRSLLQVVSSHAVVGQLQLNQVAVLPAGQGPVKRLLDLARPRESLASLLAVVVKYGGVVRPRPATRLGVLRRRLLLRVL